MGSPRGLYSLIVTQGLSLTGSRMTGIALGIWLFRTTGSTTYLLLVPLFNELPGMLAGAAAGMVVDRFPRRLVLMASDAGQALGSLILFLSFITGQFEVWHLYLVVVLQGACNAFQGPAANAATTMLISDDQRDRANGVREMTFPLAGVIAPVLAGFLYSLIGISGIILADLATFALSILVLYLIEIPEPQRPLMASEKPGDFWRESLQGFAYLSHLRPLLILVIYSTLLNFLLNGPLELAIPYLLRRTGNELLMSMLLGVMNLGALVGGALAAAMGRPRSRIQLFLRLSLVNGLMLVVFGIARSPLVLAVSLFVLMIPLPFGSALFRSFLQGTIPAGLQGRVFGTIEQLSLVASTLSFAVTGPLVDRVLEPSVGGPSWRYVSWLFGSSAGAGMGSVIATAGCIILVLTVVTCLVPGLRDAKRPS